jgi:hypothetical protein
MTTYTITTPVNIDSLAGKTGNDTFNINGGVLTVDQHSRYGVNQNTSATMGNITLSATLGGKIEFNSSRVRLIAYSAGTGNVPAINTSISLGGASGLLLGVYASLALAPTAAGVAMPATGFILIRQWNNTAFTVGALTGIAATASGADRPGWLEIAGAESATTTVNRLNAFEMRGDYFDFLGVTTSGSRANSYQIPSNGTLVYCPGVEVETAPGSGVFEFYGASAVAALATNIATDAVRGKFCWISTAGLLRFGADGTNSTGGFLPPAGCAIRVANVFFTCATVAAPTVNVLPNATFATRPELATTGGGVIDIENASMAWYLNLSQPFSVRLANMSTFDQISLSECASPIAWSNIGIGQSQAAGASTLNMSLNFAGGTLSRVYASRASLPASSSFILSMADSTGFTFTDCRFQSCTKGVVGSAAINLARTSNCLFTRTRVGGARVNLTTAVTGVKFEDTTYYDHPATNTQAANPCSVFELTTSCSNITMDGVEFGGLTLCQPYNSILSVGSSGCTDIKLRNIGTYLAPLSLGSPRVDDVAWSRVTTTATVTSPGHPFIVGDTVFVVVSSNTAAITVALKTLTAVTADTFTFAALSAGAASGTLCYFGAKCGLLFSLGTGAAANNIKVQRVYAPHTRLNLYTSDNSSRNITLENVFSDYLNAPLFDSGNMFSKNVSGTPPMSARPAVYGTHWFNGYVCDNADFPLGCTWTRAGTVVTVTSIGHSLRTGMVISVTASSNIAAVPTAFYGTVTALTSSTFTIVGLNAGATSGTLDMRVGNGRIGVVMNEPTAATADQVSFDAGSPAFTSAGGLYMPAIGDQVTFTSPDYMIGQGSTFPIMEVVMGGSTLTRYHLTYAIDKNDGLGFSGFKNLYYERGGGAGGFGANTFSVGDATGVAVGDYAVGSGIAGNALVTNVSGNTITVDQPNTNNVVGTIRFNALPSETNLGPETGIKLRIRIVTVTANTVPITSLYILANSTNAGRQLQYPLDINTVMFTGLPTGCDAVVLTAGTGTILDQRDQIAGTSYTFTFSGAQTIDVGFIKPGFVPFYIRGLALVAADSSIPVSLTTDRNYI